MVQSNYVVSIQYGIVFKFYQNHTLWKIKAFCAHLIWLFRSFIKITISIKTWNNDKQLTFYFVTNRHRGHIINDEQCTTLTQVTNQFNLKKCNTNRCNIKQYKMSKCIYNNLSPKMYMYIFSTLLMINCTSNKPLY